MTWFKDLSEEKFNHLLVVSFSHRDGTRYFWNCRCDCGNNVIVTSRHLKQGHTKSCGCIKRVRKTVPKESSFGHLFSSYKYNAAKRNLEFSLNKEEFAKLTKSNCFYCGKEPSQICFPKWANESYIYNGIDRKNNSIGYNIENCVPCCKQCNMAKHAFTFDEFREWVKRISSNLENW